ASRWRPSCSGPLPPTPGLLPSSGGTFPHAFRRGGPTTRRRPPPSPTPSGVGDQLLGDDRDLLHRGGDSLRRVLVVLETAVDERLVGRHVEVPVTGEVEEDHL